MYRSQYYTCEQIDQRLLQGYLDDYNNKYRTSLNKDQFLELLNQAFNPSPQALADEEDITVVSDKLKFKDKAYNVSSFSGLGRTYLRKNIVSNKNVLTQAMMSAANTIYHIQYDYDLDGETITVPAGCVLEFDGGSLRNGTLNFGDGVNIKSEDYKIFYNVLFTGNCDMFFHIDWFVENYSERVTDESKDATSEIQFMFNSGIKKVWLTNKRCYRITDTITIPSNITVDGVRQKGGYVVSGVYDQKYIYGSIDKPLIIVKAVSGVTTSVTIKNIYLYRRNSIDSLTRENEYKSNISTIYVDCTEGSIWGFYFWGVIDQQRTRCTFYAADGTTTLTRDAGGYLGIEIYAANDKYISYVDLGGYILECHKGIKVHTDDSSSWINAVNINYWSESVYGGYICCDVWIGGQHQSRRYLPTNEDSFFVCDGVIVVTDGRVWDTGYGGSMQDNDFYSTRYSFKADAIKGSIQHNLYANNVIDIKDNWDFSPMGNANKFANLIPNEFYGDSINNTGLSNITFKVFESDEDYEDYIDGDTTKGIDITKDNTFGFYDLFYPDKMYYDNAGGRARTSNYARLSYVKDIPVKKVYFKCFYPNGMRCTGIVHSVLSSSTMESTVTRTYNDERIFAATPYYTPIYVPLSSSIPAADCFFEVVVTYKDVTIGNNIPYIGVCTTGVGGIVGPWGGYVAGPLVSSNLQCCNGEYKSVKSHPIMANRIGTGGSSEERILRLNIKSVKSYFPVTILLENYEGEKITVAIYYKSSEYFYSVTKNVAYNDGYSQIKVYRKNGDYILTIKRSSFIRVTDISGYKDLEIIEDLSSVDLSEYDVLTQTIMSIATIGATSNRPALPSNGSYHFDTTTNKPMWWNGSKWVESDGATADVARSGTFANKPAATDIYVGFKYFCTDKQTTEGATNGIEIIHKGNGVWVDALGRVVS